MSTLRWGILGTGNIATQFANGVAGATRSSVSAVASRSADGAQAFAQKFDISHAIEGYDRLLERDDVDAVYVSLPNAMHHEWTIRALEAGKHVLCEKPFANSVDQAREMFDAADRADRLLVEAFMYVSHPMMKAVVEHVRAGEIGDVQAVRSSFCYRTKRVEGNTRFDTALHGGGLMDVGCYCISFARLVTGEEPDAIHAVGRLHASGVDDLVAANMQFPSGVVSDFICGMTTQANNSAFICGTEGYIEIPVPWKPPVERAAYSVRRMTPPRMDRGSAQRKAEHTYHVDAGKPLYAMEADDFAAAVLDGTPPAVSREHTIGNMVVLDTMRGQIGLPY